MDLVRESKKILDTFGLLSKKSCGAGKSPNFIGNKSATNILLDTDVYSSSKIVFISESIALDLLRVSVLKSKKKLVFYNREKNKIYFIDNNNSISKSFKGDVYDLYESGKPFKGIVDLVCFMGLFFSDDNGVTIYNKSEFGKELELLKSNMIVNSNTMYISLTHDKLVDDINSEHFMNTDNYIKANLIVTPTNIYHFK
jgi:hypothetical protein